MNERVKGFLVYAGKCVSGALLVFVIARFIHYTDIGWSLISVMLVLSPDGKDSVALALTRIKANIAGASVAVVCLFIAPENIWSISIAIVLTMGICYLFKLDAGIRSALAAAIIIMLHNEGKHLWDTAIERIIGVLAGCALALLITFIFHRRLLQSEENNNQQEA